jgi:hypothetical protein
MSCIETNRSAEEVRNIVRNYGTLFNPKPDDSVEQIKARIDYVKENLILHHRKDDPDDTYYTFFDVPIEKRVSELGKKAWQSRVGGAIKAKQINQRPDNIKKRKAGIFFHGVLSQLIDFYGNNKGNLTEIRKEALNHDIFRMSDNHLEALKTGVQDVVKQIKDIQKKIDPKGQVHIYSENGVIDPVHNRGGTTDVFALFSDGSAINYDFKIKHSHGDNYKGEQLIDELMGTSDIEDYNLNMSEYKRIYEERFGVKFFRENRLIPVHIRLKPLRKDLQGDYNYFSTELDKVEIGEYASRYLRQVPIAGELTEYERLNTLLEKQMKLVNKLRKKQSESGITILERERLEAKIKSITRATQKTIMKADISDIFISIYQILDETEQALAEHKYTPDGKLNNNYPEIGELQELYDEVNVYTELMDNTLDYFEDMQKREPELYEVLNEKRDKAFSAVHSIKAKLHDIIEQRILEDIPSEYKTPKGGLAPQKELNFITQNFNRISQIQNPVFKQVWKLIQTQIHKTRQYVKSVGEEIADKEKALFQWASNNGLSRQAAFDKMINFETGNLISKYDKEFWDKVNKARLMSPEEGAPILKTIYDIDEKKFNEETYKQRYERIQAIYKARFPEEREYKNRLNRWVENNNLLKSDKAWINPNNTTYLKIKPEVEDRYKSEEYKYLEANKPLLGYYSTYIKYMNAFRHILKIDNISELPPNFIPNIRKEASDYIGRERGGVMHMFREFFDSFKVREEDIYLADYDENGIQRRIPILFKNPLRNRNGEIDLMQKSYNLSSSLIAFAEVVKNYELMSEIEPTILGLKGLIGNPSAAQEGTEITTQTGRRVKGVLKKIATKVGFSTDTYKLLEDYIDYYLYGIKFKEKSLSKKINTVKLITDLKQYHSKRALSFAIIPSAGAFIASKVTAYFEGLKGMSYTRDMMNKAYKLMATDYKRVKAACKLFDVYAEDPIDRLKFQKSINRVSKVIDPRTLFMPLRKVDENHNDATLIAMMHNYGINKDGNLVRLNRPGQDVKDVKPLIDIVEYNEETGKVSIDGLNLDNYIQFRNAVKGTSDNTIGSLSQEDIAKSDMSLALNVMMAFKSWMPGIVRERFGDLVFDDHIQAARWGRFRAVFSEIIPGKDELSKLSDSELQAGFKFNEFIGQVLAPNLAKATLDLITFGGLRNVLGEVYTDPTGKTRRVRTNIRRAQRRYQQWMLENPELQGKVTFDDFLEMKEGQIRAMLAEIRTILSFAALLLFLGGDGDDGEPRYMDNWFTRTLFKMVAKGDSELMFIWNPDEFLRLMQNPVPLASLLSSTKQTLFNTFDEGRDFILGENSPYDRTPAFYYTIQWAYGGAQLERLFELYDEFQKSPY